MAMKQQRALPIKQARYAQFIPLHRHRPWVNFVMNGPLPEIKMYLEKFLGLLKCKVKEGQQAQYTEHCTEEPFRALLHVVRGFY